MHIKLAKNVHFRNWVRTAKTTAAGMKRDRQDVDERLASYNHSLVQDEDDSHYVTMKTTTELQDDGALVGGGAISLLSREAMALFAQYAAVGIVSSMLPALSFPIFNNYLKLEGYQTASYSQLVTLGASFKVIFGLLSDCCPIYGYRRKSWMLIGWSVTTVCLTIMTFSTLGDPYCNVEKAIAQGRPRACSTIYSKTADEDKKFFNLDAPNSGTKFILLSTLVSFAYIMAVCASDAMVVEYAQREPFTIRGRLQTAVYIVREVSQLVTSLTTGLGLSSPNYGGDFSFSIAPNVPYAICLLPCLVVIFATIYAMDDKKAKGQPFLEYIAMFWNLLQLRAMWQLCAFRFLFNVFDGIGSTASSPMYSTWANVSPLNDSVTSILGGAIFCLVLAAVAKWGLHWNWRYTIAVASFVVLAIDAPITFITIWNVFRNQWFYTGVGLSESVPGFHGATYGLITTVANLTSPFASMIYKVIDSYLKLSQDNIRDDTTEVRWDVTYSYLISYGSKVFALTWLFLLPPQRVPLQELKRHGGKSKVAGALFVLLFVVCLAFSVASNILSIFPSTKCYRIAGGDGKVDPVTRKCLAASAAKG
ncbi:hypothetical protein LEN26_016458 [Aphanomyces euteiches]|nr:hypothetical protein LEN26_016458 [Aphanomyces euteiches]